MKAWHCLILLTLAGCEKPVVQKSMQLSPAGMIDPNQLRTWVSFAEINGKTIDEIRAMKIGCFYILKPENRQECMLLLFEIHQRVTGDPYLKTITENWMTAQPIGIMVDRGNQLMIPTCEDNWQYGDLNADGRVDYTDFSIYAQHSGVPP